MRLKNDSMVTYQSREKFTKRASGNTLRTPSTGSIWPRKFWQTRSRAIVAHDSEPADCIDKVVSENGEKTLYQRLSTPRPAPKIILKSVWTLQQQQQRQQQDTFRCTRTPVGEEENSFQADLTIQGVPPNAVLEDQEGMSKIQEIVDKVRTGYQTESVIRDYEKRGKNMFTES